MRYLFFGILLPLLVVGGVLWLRFRQRVSRGYLPPDGGGSGEIRLGVAAAGAPIACKNPVTATIAAFLAEIGLPITLRRLPKSTFLPGIRIERGGLVIDEARLLYPGDLLHEAGHLAVMEPARRAAATDSPGDEMGEEIAAIAWSWAALTHLGLPPEVVFHPLGYKGHSTNFIANFQAGQGPGVPLLQWYGLTLDERNAQAQGEAPFPAMRRWLRA